ncbi:hypothetical protein Harman_11800 [Haloarcula mannanilytica]|uniref:Uncharacterized protein n=1 Tax=Haloarcula mannanilytica TaxID=2509225 RepID=A0A4C2EFM7_9EURY|nr:hypothetical protein [Haloarcula mannanilytica]GCF13245.1 hypothetical protein Harman_11800 [Haloarcula mannanilytica]
MSEDQRVPGFVWRLAPLAGVVGFLTSFAEDPTGTLRDIILDVVLSFVLGGILDVLSQLVDLLLQAFEQAANAPVLAAQGILDAGRAIGGIFIGGIGIVADLAGALVAAAGPFGPIIMFGLAAIIIYVRVEVVAILVDSVVPQLGDLLRWLRGIGR